MPENTPSLPESQEFEGMRGIPFDSLEILQEDGSYDYDRVFYSEDFAEWYRDLFSNGILIPGGTTLSEQLSVIKSSAYQATINPGRCIILGRHGRMKNPYNLAVSAVSEGSQRIDRVVVEMNEQDRKFNLKILQGKESVSSPVAPELRREEIEVSSIKYEIWQLSLAQLLVKPEGIETIIDERSDNSVCGVAIVVPGVEKPQLPTGDSAANIGYNNASTGMSSVNVQEAIDELHDMNESTNQIIANKVKELKATIPVDGWLENGTGYTLTIPVSGVKSTDNPIVDIVSSTSPEVARQESTAWGLIYKIETLDNNLKCYAEGIPEKAVSIQIKVVR